MLNTEFCIGDGVLGRCWADLCIGRDDTSGDLLICLKGSPAVVPSSTGDGAEAPVEYLGSCFCCSAVHGLQRYEAGLRLGGAIHYETGTLMAYTARHQCSCLVVVRVSGFKPEYGILLEDIWSRLFFFAVNSP